MSTPTDIEKENLEAHVELCAQRYTALEKRLDTIEEKVTELHNTMESSHGSMVKVLIGTAGTVIVGIVSAVAAIVTHLPAG